MNWSTLSFMLVFIAVFVIVVLTVLFYIRHWSGRQAASSEVPLTEGAYFKRYIPIPLREGYDNQLTGSRKKRRKTRSLWAGVFTGTIVIFASFILVRSLISNVDQMLLPIELSKEETSEIIFSHHQWQQRIDQNLPDLTEILASLHLKGIIIPDDTMLRNGQDFRRQAVTHWENFTKNNNLDLQQCAWNNFQMCLGGKNSQWIVVVLPGHWDFEVLDNLLEEGVNVLAYGPPAQIFEDNTANPLEWHGLTFEKGTKNSDSALILMGDRLLTLGFDAGLVVDAPPLFDGYRTVSKTPQALALSSSDDISMGGEMETRLYAETIGKGRLVWLDFAPDITDHLPSINTSHLNALMGSIFRYFSRKPFSAIATWPDAKTFAALIEQDSEDGYQYTENVIDLLKRKHYPITWYMLSSEALKNRTLTRTMASFGEVACHGDTHEPFTKSDQKQQHVRIARCQKVIHEITGKRPQSFRPPEEKFNAYTIDAIVNAGMTYYIPGNTTDRAVPIIQDSLTTGQSIVSLPRLVTDDYHMWHLWKKNLQQTKALMDKEIAWMNEVGGIYMYSFHSQYMNDEDNLKGIEYLGDRFQAENIYFKTSGEISEWWRYRDALKNGLLKKSENINKFSAVLLSANEKGEISKAPYSYKEVASHAKN
ncbi:MAG: polysaccharide deacetylase family protein [Methylococcaceae bacterium]